jgi:hypothetical protein
MSRPISRRRLIVAGGAASLGAMATGQPRPAAARRMAAAPESTPPGPLVVLFQPFRAYDSRSSAGPLGGAKLRSGESVLVTIPVGQEDGGFVVAVFVNCTVTDTEGSGYLVLRGSDLSGERPLPSTSNVNWSTDGQTLANLALCDMGGENAIEVHAGGNGRTHVIVDVQGYVPFVP